MHPASNTSAADWLLHPPRPFGGVVESLIPTGFESYVRILHPAYVQWRRHGENNIPISWQELARSMGSDLPTLAQRFETGHSGDDTDDAVDQLDRTPMFGTTPVEILAALVPTLRAATTTPDRCWFATWEGWADLPEHVGTAPMFSLPWRAYYLLQGHVDEVGVSFSVEPMHHQSPNIWWPDDRSWCVAVEVDLLCTYVGGSNRCIGTILRNNALESAKVGADDPLI